MDRIQVYVDKAVVLGLEFGPKLLLALLTLLIGLSVIKGMTRVVERSLVKAKVDITLRPFVVSMASWGLKLLLFISVASMVGIETTSFIAVLGAAGLAIGLALQGSLTNFAGGVLLLIFRPYEVGHLIETQGHVGVVQEIQIFTTILLTPDQKTVIVPNGAVSNGSITNFTRSGTRRVDLIIGISYGADIQKAREVLMEIMTSDEKVFSDPPPMVAVDALADSSVNLAVRPHTTPEHYWDVYFGIQEKAKLALDAAGIAIPFPQRDVHIIKEEA